MTAWFGRASIASTSSGSGAVGMSILPRGRDAGTAAGGRAWWVRRDGPRGYGGWSVLVVADLAALGGRCHPARLGAAAGVPLLLRLVPRSQRRDVGARVGHRLVALDVGPPGGGVAGHGLEPLARRRLQTSVGHP